MNNICAVFEMKFNYHTHTARCMHATGADEEYVLAAIEAGFDEIGFSDHCAWPYENYTSGIRMTVSEIEDYALSINRLKEKYKGKISIKLGWECEYFEIYIDWLKEIVRKYEFDYLILGHHYSPIEKGGDYNGRITKPRQIENYKNGVIKAMDSGLFSYVAHPDLYMKGYRKFDKHAEKVAREIIAKSIETDTPLEYNLLGLYYSEHDGFMGYPYHDFWVLAGEMKAKCIIGIDAHKSESYLETAEKFKNSKKLLEGLGLELASDIRFFNYK